MEIKVPREKAEAEVAAWLDEKKVFPTDRETYKIQVEKLIEACMYGYLVFQDGQTVHNLLMPLSNMDKLTYVNRANGATLGKNLHDVKSDDGDGRYYAFIAAVSNTPKGVIKSLDSSDLAIAKAYVIFFI